MFAEIDSYIAKFTTLTTEETEFYHALLEYKKVPKKTFLLREGEICDFEAFIISGCMRSYYIDEKGDEVIILFPSENWWASDIASFYAQSPSDIFIETIEPCEILSINYNNKQRLYKELPKFERVFRILVQRSHTVLQKRFFNTVARPAKERYLEFLQKYPSLPNRVPQHYIASYIGISPEFLSKIRKELAGK